MNKPLLKITTLLAVSAAVATFTACSKSDRDDIADTTKDAYQNTKDAVSKGFENLKSYTFEKRSDFQKELAAQQASVEAGISDMKADYSEATASASRKAAWQELKDADADYKAKFSALGDASADTWDAARDRASAAWDRLQEAYRKARASD